MQQVGSLQPQENLTTPSLLYQRPSELWAIHFCCLLVWLTLSTVFCNSSMKGPRQYGFHLMAINQCWAHILWRTKGRTQGCALSDSATLSVLPKAPAVGCCFITLSSGASMAEKNSFFHYTHCKPENNKNNNKRRKGWADISRQLTISSVWHISKREVIYFYCFDYLYLRKARSFPCASLWYSQA